MDVARFACGFRSRVGGRIGCQSSKLGVRIPWVLGSRPSWRAAARRNARERSVQFGA